MFAWKSGRTDHNAGERGRSRPPSAAARLERPAKPTGVSWDVGTIPVYPSEVRGGAQAPGGPRGITVGPANDPLERQAERSANDAMQASGSFVATPASSAERTAAAGIVDRGSVGNVLASPGRPLDGDMLHLMESRLGHDFSRVRVHDDAAAASAAVSMGARAFTVGTDVAFSESLNGASFEGRHLLAHELAHVVQQSSRGNSSLFVQRQPKQTQAQQAGPTLPQPIIALLQQASEGQWALNALNTYKVTLVLTNVGLPAKYEANSNTCTMNIALPPGVVASYFVHEMYHAQQEKTGKSGDAKKMDKQTFVGTMVNEEIAGTVKGYQAYMELEQKGQV